MGAKANRRYRGYAEGGEVKGDKDIAEEAAQDEVRQSTKRIGELNDKTKAATSSDEKMALTDQFIKEVEKNASLFGKTRMGKSLKAANERDKNSTRDVEAIQQGMQNARDESGARFKGYAKGGKILRTAGKPVGKDDGLIPAQRGEYVIRKSAVKKLGTQVLDKINQGELPTLAEKRYSKHQ